MSPQQSSLFSYRSKCMITTTLTQPYSARIVYCLRQPIARADPREEERIACAHQTLTLASTDVRTYWILY